jgi:hypothetical protein
MSGAWRAQSARGLKSGLNGLRAAKSACADWDCKRVTGIDLIRSLCDGLLSKGQITHRC